MTADQKILSTQGYRGTRDFFPDNQRVRNYIYKHIHTVMHQFGYEEYQGPILEPLELYAAKSSEEIVREQLYSFVDKGQRTLAIRPEMTPTLARMVAQKCKELPRPIRWYSIPTCMRFERPQRGRFREFDQLNVDILGGLSIDEDLEIILTCVALMNSFGGPKGSFEVLINHRGVVNDFLYRVLQIPETHKSAMMRLLDKRDKMTAEEFTIEGQKLELTELQLTQLELFLSSNLEQAQKLLGEHQEHIGQLIKRFEILSQVIDPQYLKFSPGIMRGFEYYTGLVFEIFDTAPENRRALFGGGRYDNLLESFGVDSLPGVGYGVSDVALINYLEVHKLIPDLKKQTDICVVRFSEADRVASLQLADELRKLNLNIETCVTATKFGKQIQAAERNGARAIAFRGDDELKNNTFSVKWLDTGAQEIFSMNDIEKIKNKFNL